MWMTTMWVLLIISSDGNCVLQYQDGFISKHHCEKAAGPFAEIPRDHGQRGVDITITTQCLGVPAPRDA